jgi:DNA repair protein RecO (recombination protein O)
MNETGYRRTGAVARLARDHLRRCFVLHRRDYANTSLILDLFCEAEGRVAVIAKGAKRGRGTVAAVLQPFVPLWASWTGRGEVPTLARCEPAGPAINLGGRTLFCGLYLNELMVRLLQRGDPHEALFAFYHSALSRLGGTADVETVLRQFELRLLEEMGYSPVLDREGDSGEPVRAGRWYICEPGSAPRRGGAGEGAALVRGETLIGLAAGGALAGELAREARDLMRALLAPHLGPRPLKSRELFRRG